jgi:2-haloacid dehalogenase
MLVAAHNNDLEAAGKAGLATAFVARPEEHGPSQHRDLTVPGNWDLAATSITGLAAQLRDHNHGRSDD